MNSSPISLTTEALIALAAGYGCKPPVFWLLQLGFDPNSEQSETDYMGIIDRGARSLAAVQAQIDVDDTVKRSLRDGIEAMSGSPAFVSMRRSDLPNFSVLYCGERAMADDIDAFGNHTIREVESSQNELADFFGAYHVDQERVLEIDRDRFLGRVGPSEDEDEWATRLLSDDSLSYVLSIHRSSESTLEFLQWRSAAECLFRLMTSADTITATTTSTTHAVEETLQFVSAQ